MTKEPWMQQVVYSIKQYFFIVGQMAQQKKVPFEYNF